MNVTSIEIGEARKGIDVRASLVGGNTPILVTDMYRKHIPLSITYHINTESGLIFIHKGKQVHLEHYT